MRWIVFILVCFQFLNCKPYYKFKNQWVENEVYSQFKLKHPKDSLYFNAYTDYYKDTIALDKVYLTSKEMRQVKRSFLQGFASKQALFLHNESEFYLNINVLFYPKAKILDLTHLDEFQVEKFKTGIRVNHSIHNKRIADFFVPYKTGLLRFITVENPKNQAIIPERFQTEIDYLLFTLNDDLFQ